MSVEIQDEIVISTLYVSYYQQYVFHTGCNQKPLYQLVYSLMGRPKQLSLPKHTSSSDLAVTFNEFFSSKISKLREGLDLQYPPNYQAHPPFFSAQGRSFRRKAALLKYVKDHPDFQYMIPMLNFNVRNQQSLDLRRIIVV